MSAAAFGADPGRWPLPAARTPGQRWLRAVAAGGQGYYAVAHAELLEVLRVAPPAPWASLALSTRGSLLRQLGGHRVARGCDGRALAEAGGDAAARLDALVGLAADALGVGRHAVAGALLDRAGEVVAGDAPIRPTIRLQWVSAELAMATGDGARALDHARRGAELALAWPSVRHRIKSDVVTAAALCAAGRLDRSRSLADGLLHRAAEHGLLPLRWAVASLLVGIGSQTYAPERVRAIRDDAAELIRRRGGRWGVG